MVDKKEIEGVLKTWGASDIELISGVVWFQMGGRECSLKIGDGELKTSDIVKYSCCGEPIEDDYMICPTCGMSC